MTVHPIAQCRWCGGRFVQVYAAQWLCETDACQHRQIAHATLIDPRPEDGSTPYRWLPTPSQVEVLDSTAPNLLFGGSAGGSKSFGLRWNAYTNCMAIENYEVLLLRRTFPELESTHLIRMDRDADKHSGFLPAVYGKQERMLRFHNGSFIRGGHCESESDMSKYLSTEYDEIIFDEASTFKPSVMLEISSRARSSKPAVIARGGAFVRYGSNPGGPGALFLKDFFISRTPDPDRFTGYRAQDYAFIPAKVYDNPYLDPAYVHRLNQLEPDRRAQLLDGNWDVFVDQFFGGFSPAIHVSEAA